MKQDNQVPKFGHSDIQLRHRSRIDHLDQLNVLKEKLKPAFTHSIGWRTTSMFSGEEFSFTLFEFVPRKGFRRHFGDKRVVLAHFERETRFSKGRLAVHDKRVKEHLQTKDPLALLECAKALARMNEVRVEIF